MSNPYRFLEFHRDDGITTLILDRPPLNILDIAVMDELLHALDAIPRDETKLLLLRAKGRAFSAGVAVADHLEPHLRPMIDKFHGLFRRLVAFDFPIVAVVEGACLGGACEIVSVCDFVLATDEAKFGQPEIQLGVFPPVAAAVLADRIGEVAANDLILTGRVISPAEAWDMGLLWKVVSAEDLEQELRTLLLTLGSLSGSALRLAKRAMTQGKRRRFLDDLDRIETLFLDEMMTKEDAGEGLRAFLEKRKPLWKDR